jgi:hypothetical protein
MMDTKRTIRPDIIIETKTSDMEGAVEKRHYHPDLKKQVSSWQTYSSSHLVREHALPFSHGVFSPLA